MTARAAGAVRDLILLPLGRAGDGNRHGPDAVVRGVRVPGMAGSIGQIEAS